MKQNWTENINSSLPTVQYILQWVGYKSRQSIYRLSTYRLSTYCKMLICRRVDCRLIAKLSPIIKNHHFIPNPPKVSKHVFPRRHPNTGLVGTFICNKIQTILMKRTLISCTQIEKVDNVDTYFFSQVRGQLVQM